MPSARKAGVPPEVLQEWEADFRQKKAEQKKTGGRKLPSGSVQYTYNGVTYTAKYVGKNRSVNFPEAAYEARVEGQRSRKGEQQKIKLTPMEQLMNDYKYQDAALLTEASGQRHVVDHIDPIDAGGFSNAPWNLQVLTEPTNAAKSNTLGGAIGATAREESRYLADLAGQLRGMRGTVGFSPFMTGVTLPPLGGFQQDTPQPSILPGGTAYKPPELEGMATDQQPMTQLPPQPQEDLSQQVMEAAGMVLTVGAGLIQGAGGVINFVTGGGF
jgi:hypothetical protein